MLSSFVGLHRKLKHNQPTPGKHKCKICKLEFDNNWTLNYHQKTRHLAIPIKCPECGKYFANTKSLEVHLVTQHSDKKDKGNCVFWN